MPLPGPRPDETKTPGASETTETLKRSCSTRTHELRCAGYKHLHGDPLSGLSHFDCRVEPVRPHACAGDCEPPVRTACASVSPLKPRARLCGQPAQIPGRPLEPLAQHARLHLGYVAVFGRVVHSRLVRDRLPPSTPSALPCRLPRGRLGSGGSATRGGGQGQAVQGHVDRAGAAGTSAADLPRQGGRAQARARPRPAAGRRVGGRAVAHRRGVAAALDVSTGMVERVRERFVEQGLEAALLPRPSKRVYARTLDGRPEARLVAPACTEPPRARRGGRCGCWPTSSWRSRWSTPSPTRRCGRGSK